MVSFECCSHLPAMESSVPVRPPATSKKLPSHSLRRFMQSCWTPPPPSQPLPLPPAPPSPFSCLPDDVLIECLVRLPRSSLPCALMVCRKWRSLLKSPEFYQHRLKIGHLDSLLFVFGGSSSGLASAVYCKSDGGWRTGSLFPPRAIVGNEWLVDYHCVEHAQPLLHAQPAVMNHQLYIVGAVPGQNSKTWSQDCTIIYDAWTKSLTRKAPMLCPRKKFACCVIGNRIFVAGGANRRDPSRDALMDAEEYIPEHDEWRPIANMPRKRFSWQ